MENARLQQDVIRPVIDIFSDTAKSQGVAIEFSCDLPDLLLIVDKMRVQQIIINLLSNAIKFSNKDDVITIEIAEPIKSGLNMQTYMIKVTDHGIGLAEKDRIRLFKPYFKSQSIRNNERNKKSNGLGLSISKRIA